MEKMFSFAKNFNANINRWNVEKVTKMTGMFWKAVPKENWPTDQDYLDSIAEIWAEPFGDMRQELVFIGQNLDQSAITDALDNCLLSEDAVLKGKEYWATFTDPFPKWETK